jgi:hypothetical protein
MANNFIPTLPRHTLYCVWIMTGDSRRPLECVWIDPEFRSFQFTNTQQTIATRATTTQRSRAKALYAEPRSLVSIPVNELPQEAKGAIRPLSLVRWRCLFTAFHGGSRPVLFRSGRSSRCPSDIGSRP